MHWVGDQRAAVPLLLHPLLLSIALSLLLVLLPAHADAQHSGGGLFQPWDPACETLYLQADAGAISQLCSGAYGFRLIVHESDIRQSVDVLDAQGVSTPLDLWRLVSSDPSQVESYQFWAAASETVAPMLLINFLSEAFSDQGSPAVVRHRVMVRLERNAVCVTDVVVGEETVSDDSLIASAATAPCISDTSTRVSTVTLRDLQMGDRGCVLLIDSEEAGGLSASLLADFSLCESRETLLGQSVYLTYVQAEIAAPSCEGAISCTQTEQIDIVSNATVRANGDCGYDEVAIQSCSGLTACWSRAQSELTLITAKLARSFDHGQLSSGAIPFAGGGGAWVDAIGNNSRYTLFSGVGVWGNDGGLREKAGLAIFESDRLTDIVICGSEAHSRMGPFWFSEAGLESSSHEFDFSLVPDSAAVPIPDEFD